MKKIVKYACMISAVAMLAGCGNQQIIDTVWRYDYAIIKMPSGEVVEGPISSWRDYDDSDSLQVVFTDGKVYYTHACNVCLIAE